MVSSVFVLQLTCKRFNKAVEPRRKNNRDGSKYIEFKYFPKKPVFVYSIHSQQFN